MWPGARLTQKNLRDVPAGAQHACARCCVHPLRPGLLGVDDELLHSLPRLLEIRRNSLSLDIRLLRLPRCRRGSYLVVLKQFRQLLDSATERFAVQSLQSLHKLIYCSINFRLFLIYLSFALLNIIIFISIFLYLIFNIRYFQLISTYLVFNIFYTYIISFNSVIRLSNFLF